MRIDFLAERLLLEKVWPSGSGQGDRNPPVPLQDPHCAVPQRIVIYLPTCPEPSALYLSVHNKDFLSSRCILSHVLTSKDG